LCLEFLEEVHLGGSVLDLGTGSGILAIAAAKLGHTSIFAVDNDPVAVRVARENVEINGFSFPVELADRPTEGPYTLLLANLIASVLVELAPKLHGALAPKGRLICGGIVDVRRDEVVDALQAVGLHLSAEKRAEDWVSLLLERP